MHATSAATASTVVARDANGYIYCNYINSSRGDETIAAASYTYDTGDGWIRKKSLANTRTEIIGGASAGTFPTLNQNTTGDLIGNRYISGGAEKPNNAIFGPGKLRYQMLSSTNLGIGVGSWNDVLWVSSYTGLDVKGSNALIMSKDGDYVGVSRTNYDATTWSAPKQLAFTTSNITGNAATATTATTANALNAANAYTGTSFNAITGLASVAPAAPAVTAVVGVSTTVARQDHVHPTNFTATATDIKMNGTQAVGTLTTFPRADHVHPIDTSRAAAATSVSKDSDTGAAYMPSGTTAQRPANPSNGYMRYNTTLLSMEVYSNGEWGSVGGGDGIKATGGGTDQVFTYINKYTVTTSYTTPDNESVLTVADPLGNVNLAAGVTVTLGSNSRWVIL
jgi:hypothetical protein